MKAKRVNESIGDLLKGKKLDIQQQIKWAAKFEQVDAFFKLMETHKLTSRVLSFVNTAHEKFASARYGPIMSALMQKSEKYIRSITAPEDFDKVWKTINAQKLRLYAQTDKNKFLELLKTNKLTLGALRLVNDTRLGIMSALREKGKEYVRSVTAPEDFERAWEVISAKDLDYRSYPRGYKQYRALKYVNENHPKTRTEIIKLIYELGYGPGSFNPFKSASYWSTSYHNIIGQYVIDTEDGKRLTRAGSVKLSKLERKFGQMNVDAYV